MPFYGNFTYKLKASKKFYSEDCWELNRSKGWIFKKLFLALRLMVLH